MAHLLHQFENILDQAFAKGGELASALVRARHSHGLSAVVGQRAFAAIGEAQLAIAHARGHAVEGHRMLDKVAGAIGADDPAFGDGLKGPTFAVAGSDGSRVAA